MNLKLTGFLGVVLLVLMGFLFFYERPRMAAEKHAKEEKNHVVDVARQNMARLTLINKNGRFVAEKIGTEWKIIEPVEAVGNWELIEGMVTAAKDVERGRVVVDSLDYVNGKVDLSGFGLAPPQVEVRFEPQNGQEVWLLFGDDNPAKKAAYLTWSGGHRVVLTKRDNRDFFVRKLQDLRDKHMLPMDQDRIHRFVLERPDGIIEAFKEGIHWQLTRPVRDRAETPAIGKLLSKLGDEHVVEFVSESVDRPVQYGFDDPAYRLVLYDKDSIAFETLLLGKQIPDERLKLWYGRVLSRQQVFTVEPFILDYLNVKPSLLRYMQVFEFDRTGVDRVQLAYLDRIIECQKDAAGNWLITRPEGYEAEGNAVPDLIDRVHNLRAEDFAGVATGSLDAFGLEAPKLVVTLWQKTRQIRQVRIGQHHETWFGLATELNEVVVLPYQVMSGFQLNIYHKKSEDKSKSGV